MSIGLKYISFQPYVAKPWRFLTGGASLQVSKEDFRTFFSDTHFNVWSCLVVLSIFPQQTIITNPVLSQFFRLQASNLFVQDKCLAQSTHKSENNSKPARVSLILPTEPYIKLPIGPTKKSTFNVQCLNIWNFPCSTHPFLCALMKYFNYSENQFLHL